MKATALPSYEVRSQRCVGAPYIAHAIYVDGQLIHSQLGPYADGQAEKLVLEHVNGAPQSRAPETYSHYPRGAGRPRKGEQRNDNAEDE